MGARNASGPKSEPQVVRPTYGPYNLMYAGEGRQRPTTTLEEYQALCSTKSSVGWAE